MIVLFLFLITLGASNACISKEAYTHGTNYIYYTKDLGTTTTAKTTTTVTNRTSVTTTTTTTKTTATATSSMSQSHYKVK